MKNRNAIVWASIALLPALLLFEYIHRILQLDVYQYVPVLFLAVGMLFWVEWDKNLGLPIHWFNVALIVIGVLLVGLAAWVGSPWIGCVAALHFWAAFLNSQCSNLNSSRTLWPLIIPSLLVLRAPLQLDNQLTAGLQVATTAFSSFVLDTIGILHRSAGNIFFLEGGSLFVENACSGVQSLFSLLFVSSLVLVGFKRPLILLPLYLLTGAVWALIMNVLRVTTIAIAQEWYHADLAHGWQHEVLGYICLLLAIGLLFSSDRLFQVLFYVVPDNENEQLGKSVNPLILIWNRVMGSDPKNGGREFGKSKFVLLARLQVPIAAMTLVLAIVTNVLAYRALASVRAVTDTPIWLPPEELLANVETDLKVYSQTTASRSQESALGKYSVLWNCEACGLPLRIAVSQYDEYHDLCLCYGASGWIIKERELSSVSNESGDWRYVTAKFTNSESTFGTLLFSSMSRNGLPIDARDVGFWASIKGRFGDPGDRMSARFDSESMNIQFWITSDQPLDSTQLDKLRKLHELVRVRVQQSVKSNAG